MGVKVSRTIKAGEVSDNSSTNNQSETKTASLNWNTTAKQTSPTKLSSNGKTVNRDSNNNEIKKNSPASLTSETNISCHGDSSKPIKHLADDYALIREADQHWLEINQTRSKCQPIYPSHTSYGNRWMNNAASHPLFFNDSCWNGSQLCTQCHCHNSTDRKYSSRIKRSNRRSSTNSITSLMDIRGNYGTSHTRRCSTARCLLPKRDMETLSADIIDSPMNPIWKSMQDTKYSITRRSLELPHRNRMCTGKSTNLQSSNVFLNQNRSGVDFSCCPGNSNQACILSRCSEQSEDVCPSLQNDLFPLRYVFYIEDLPNSLEAFTTGGAISTFARESRCRVYLHSRNRNFDKSNNLKVVQPALYYRGKRVCPVTVAAPNLFRLRRFLETVDAHYPEFNASTFLSDYLITPAQIG